MLAGEESRNGIDLGYDDRTATLEEFLLENELQQYSNRMIPAIDCRKQCILQICFRDSQLQLEQVLKLIQIAEKCATLERQTMWLEVHACRQVRPIQDATK